MADTYALKNYHAVCQALDQQNLQYTRHDDNLVVTLGIQGEHAQVTILFHVDEKRNAVMLLSKLPFDIPEDKRVELALYIAAINNHLFAGCFDLDVFSGSISFRLATVYAGSVLDKEAYSQVFAMAVSSIDAHSEKLSLLLKGEVSIEQLINEMNK